jgi:hypothetical protein
MEEFDLHKEFFTVETQCIEYDNCINNNDKNFLETLKRFNVLVEQVQSHNVFSPNEEIADILTENLKFLLIPFYQGDTLFRLMDERKDRIKISKVSLILNNQGFMNEFLKLMNHYGFVNDDVRKELIECSLRRNGRT